MSENLFDLLTANQKDIVHFVFNKLETAGYEVYIIGGAVRDLLLGRSIKDIDLTTNATPDEIRRVFKDYPIINNNGEKHGTVTVRYNEENIEITTYRIDGEYKDNRHPESVEFTKDIVKDLARRDFTINAMAYTGGDTVLDPVGGLKDLKDGIVRAVGDPRKRFAEDALRILRMIRFASVLDFNISQSTLECGWLLRKTLSYISKERIREEINKMIIGPGFARLATNYYVMDILSEVLPIRNMFHFDQKNPAHLWDLWTHTLHVLKYSMEQLEIKDYKLALAALFHDIAKPYTKTAELDENGEFVRFHFPDHPRQSANIVEKWLREYKYSMQEITYIKTLVLLHDEREFADCNRTKIKLLLNKLATAINSTNKTQINGLFGYLAILKDSDVRDHDYSNTKYKDIKWLNTNQLVNLAQVVKEDNVCYLLKDLAINGNDLIELGVKPGPAIKDLLEECLNDVINGKIENTKIILIDKVKHKLINKLN